jgi:hypothetical protein
MWELLHTKDGQKNVGVCRCIRVFLWIEYIFVDDSMNILLCHVIDISVVHFLKFIVQ